MDGGALSGVWSAFLERKFGERECLGFVGKGMSELVHSDDGENQNSSVFAYYGDIEELMSNEKYCL